MNLRASRDAEPLASGVPGLLSEPLATTPVEDLLLNVIDPPRAYAVPLAAIGWMPGADLRASSTCWPGSWFS